MEEALEKTILKIVSQESNKKELNIPEAGLWLAVLFDAIRSVKNKDKYDILWIRSKNTQVGSFLWICDSLGLCPNWVLKTIKDNWKKIKNKNFVPSKLAKAKSKETLRSRRFFRRGES